MNIPSYRHGLVLVAGLLAALSACLAPPACAQDRATAPKGQPLAVPPLPDGNRADFLHAADEVLAEMSQIVHLAPQGELKKSIRSREEIREYILKDFREDKDKDKRRADELMAKKLGLLPETFPLDDFLVDLLTEQIAGLYDPKTREFYIADWIEPGEQREVMAHELTHALQDEHYSIDKWADAAKPNDDAEFARHAVLEGSAFAAMMDWTFRGQGLHFRDVPNLDKLLNPEMMSGGEKDSKFESAPPYLRDVLLFPYLTGAVFTQRLLQEYGGWPGFYKIFASPPASTQQILHPELYLKGVAPAKVAAPALPAAFAPKWKKLDETVAGEFFLLEWLKQFSNTARAQELAAAWSGDRYAVYEEAQRPTGAGTVKPRVMLVWRIRTSGDAAAARLFGGMSQAVDMRYDERRDLLRRPNYFEFQTPQGGVFVRCLAGECLLVDGADRALYDALTAALGWPAAPAEPAHKSTDQEVARLRMAPPPLLPAIPEIAPAAAY
jgi:hypothetical protein